MNEFIGIVINTDGTLERVDVKTYADIQKSVGGTFDVATSFSGNTSLWVHDEGKILGLKVNPVASVFFKSLNPKAFDILCGPVLIAGGCSLEGDILSIGSEALDKMVKLGITDYKGNANVVHEVRASLENEKEVDWWQEL